RCRFGFSDQFVEDGLLLGSEEHLDRLGGTDLDTFEAADAPRLIDDRLAGFVHFNAVDRADTLAPGSAGNALPLDERGLAPRFFNRFYCFSHGISFVGATHASPKYGGNSNRARHASPLQSQ